MPARYIIIDLTHGGKILAKEFNDRGDCEVIGVDIYKTTDSEERSLFEQNGITIIDGLDKIELKKSDIITAPVHCNPDFLSKAISEGHKIVSFHEIVNNILKEDLKDKFIIEITGNRGKTTTALTLAKLLSYEKSVICLSSRGLEYFQNGVSMCLIEHIEIAPPYLMYAKKFISIFDIAIFEISLGGTGLADIGILTNIIEDYPIASLKKTASSAKKQIIEFAKEHSIIFYNIDDENSKKLLNSIKTIANVISFGENGHIKAKKPVILDFTKPTEFNVEYNFRIKNKIHGKMDCQISSKLLGLGYFYALLVFIGCSLILGIQKDKIIKYINSFNGIIDRLYLEKQNNRWILKDINSGVGHLSINAALESVNPYLKHHKSKIWLILDLETEVCEPNDLKKIQNNLSKWDEIIAETYSTDLKIGKPINDKEKLIDKLLKEIGEKDIIFIVKKVRG